MGVICKVEFTADLSHWDVYKQGMCWLMLKQNSGEMVLVLWQPIHSSSGMQISESRAALQTPACLQSGDKSVCSVQLWRLC